jgi:hypothetical protein
MRGTDAKSVGDAGCVFAATGKKNGAVELAAIGFVASRRRQRARSGGDGVQGARARAVGRHRGGVEFDRPRLEKHEAEDVAEVSPLEGSPLRTKKDDDDALVAALRGLLKRLTPSGYVDRIVRAGRVSSFTGATRSTSCSGRWSTSRRRGSRRGGAAARFV